MQSKMLVSRNLEEKFYFGRTLEARAINDQMLQVERAFINPEGLPGPTLQTASIYPESEQWGHPLPTILVQKKLLVRLALRVYSNIWRLYLMKDQK